jgi:conjugative transfer signal peptidase TraF
VPVGFYLLHPGADLRTGDLVVFEPPIPAARLLLERGYLPTGTSLLKRVVALAGDTVCLDGELYAVNGRVIARVLHEDAGGRPLPIHRACGPVGPTAAYVATSAPRSFDSRYFGPVPITTLTKVTPIWTF